MGAASTLVSLIPILLSVSFAQPNSDGRIIVFSDLIPLPTGFERYDPSALSPGASIQKGPSSIPLRFRSHVKAFKSFTYTATVAPGKYSLKFGFLEFSKCTLGSRVFTITANGKATPTIDTFAAKGCKTRHIVNLFNVKAYDGTLTLKANAVKGGPPFLATVQIIKRANPPATTKPPPTANRASSVVFTNGAVPKGWTRYKQNRLTKGVQIVNSGVTALRLPFRSFAKKNAGFAYFEPLAPGTYRITMGFAETTVQGCAVGKRVFKVKLNGKDTKDIDVFNEVGCKKPFSTSARFTLQPGAKKVNIRLVPVKGFVPMISNFRIARVGGGGTVAPPSTVPSTTKPVGTGSKSVVLDVDVGGPSDPLDDVTGTTELFNTVVPISGTTRNSRFSRHRFGEEFSYVLKVQPLITYGVTLDFAESFESGCMDGFRAFDVAVYDSAKGVSSGKMIKGLMVFEEAGCRAALQKTLTGINVGPSGSLTIKLMAVQNNAYIAGFQIFTKDPAFGGTPTPTPFSGPLKTSAQVNVGSGEPGDVALPGTKKMIVDQAIVKTTSVTQKQLQTSRFGGDFTYRFNLKPGAYDIVLAFSENFDQFCTEPGKRVFNVFVNDLIQLEGFDIFAQAGCFKGIEVMLERQTVGAVDVQPLTIRFASVVNFAQVNFIRIKKAAKACVPASNTGQLSADHAAHSVPGSYPPQNTANAPKSYVDTAGKGFVNVLIDGSKSHTHFFDPANNIVGKLTSYTWSNVETGKIVSRKKSFSSNFPLGVTRLKLAVTDNSCTSDEAETTVTVTGKIQPGAYCYYYKGLKGLPKSGAEAASEFPQFAKVSQTLNFGFPDFPFKNTAFGARCLFFLEVDKASAASDIFAATLGSGRAKVFKGEDLIIDSDASPLATTSLSVGLTGFEIVYFRTNLAKPAKLDFFVNENIPPASKISHDRTTVRPILTSVSPKDGPLSGGTKVKVGGHGLFSPLTVKFGGISVPVLPSGATPNQFFVNTPASSSASTASIVVTSAAGVKSNSILFKYGSSCDNIKFTATKLTQQDGKDVDLKLPTSVAIGQDGKIYFGTLGGTVQVLGYNINTMKVTSRCQSKPITDNRFKKNGNPSQRSILGLTFDPRDKVVRPYVTTSTYDWWLKDNVDRTNELAWQNGAVDRLKPGKDLTNPKICLVYDKRIVSNLPVSNHDHSVNALLFAQNGDLLISVGGFTNMGLPGYKLGGFWETDLSGAILVAKLSKKNFDGNIKYSNPTKPRLAKKVAGDVELYATGLRNTFAMTLTTTGDLYAEDNGPNCLFGDTATTCSDYVESEAAKWKWDNGMNWKGKVKHGWVACPYGHGRPDKVLHITQGSYYGHPNLNRQECEYVDPFDNLTADDKIPPAKLNYKPPMVTMQSPLTGMAEYRAGHFCAKLKGELIISAYQDGKTFRMGVNGGSVTSGPDELAGNGGITFVENSRGDLIFPRLSQKNIFVLRPKISGRAGLYVSGAVPFRHGKAGGTKITVSGLNFGVAPQVKIGGKLCEVVSKSSTEITCKVPAHTAGAKNLAVTTGEKSAVLEKAVLYMQV